MLILKCMGVPPAIHTHCGSLEGLVPNSFQKYWNSKAFVQFFFFLLLCTKYICVWDQTMNMRQQIRILTSFFSSSWYSLRTLWWVMPLFMNQKKKLAGSLLWKRREKDTGYCSYSQRMHLQNTKSWGTWKRWVKMWRRTQKCENQHAENKVLFRWWPKDSSCEG